MAIPDFQGCMRPLLAAIQDGKVHTFNEAFEQVCLHFKLTDEERAEKLPSGKQTVIRNRIAWARTYLNKAGLMTAPERGQLQITDRGKAALQQESQRINVRFLKQFPEFVEFHSAKPKTRKATIQEDNDNEDTDPTERLEEAYGEIQQELIDEVLGTVLVK